MPRYTNGNTILWNLRSLMLALNFIDETDWATYRDFYHKLKAHWGETTCVKEYHDRDKKIR